jgi:predicted metal-dependent peptidase
VPPPVSRSAYRGGTDFQPIIDYFEQRLKYYDGLIVFTDGYAPIPKVSPRSTRKILWLCKDEVGYKEHRDWMSRLGRCGWI